jgi:hypothetical protein
MPKISQDLIQSDTHFLKLVATLEDSNKPDEWLLKIHVSGVEREFLSDTVTRSKAIEYATQFESCVEATTKDSVTSALENVLRDFGNRSSRGRK